MHFIVSELRELQAKIQMMVTENFGRYPKGEYADALLKRRDQLELLLCEHDNDEYKLYINEYY